MNKHTSPLGSGKIDGPGALTFEPERYRLAVAGLDLSDDQCDELLSTLWIIMQHMVEIGISVEDSKICESIFEPFIEATNASGSGVESSLPNDVEGGEL